jgi:hypothetical protein
VKSLTHGAEPLFRSRQLYIYSRTSQHLMEHEGSLPLSQEPSTGPYPEPDRSSPLGPILFKIHFNIVSHLRLGVPGDPFPSVFHANILYAFDWLRAQSSSPGRVKNFLFSTASRPTLEPTQPPVQWVPRSLSLEVKQPELETDHSPPASAEVKKCGSIHPLPHTPSWRSA